MFTKVEFVVGYLIKRVLLQRGKGFKDLRNLVLNK